MEQQTFCNLCPQQHGHQEGELSEQKQDVQCTIFHLRFLAYFPPPLISTALASTLFKYISFHAHLIFPLPYICMCQQCATKIRTKSGWVSSPVQLYEEVAKEERVSQSVMQSPRKRRIAVSFHSNMAKILEEKWTSTGRVVCSWVWGQRIWLHPNQMMLLKKLQLPQAPGSSYINLQAEGSFRAHEHSFMLNPCKEIWLFCSLRHSKLKILQYFENASLWKWNVREAFVSQASRL